VSEHALVAATAGTPSRRRALAANILVAVAVLVLVAMALVDAYLLTQWNIVARMFMIGVLVAVGWIPATLAIIAVCLRPYWLTFLLLGVVVAAVLAMFVIVWRVPDAPYPYPEVSWPRRGSS
jgi:hypothetical protein